MFLQSLQHGMLLVMVQAVKKMVKLHVQMVHVLMMNLLELAPWWHQRRVLIFSSISRDLR